jgi:hypothetical protein
MSNYTLAVNWSGKDALSDSDAAKVISGSDFNSEFTTIRTAVNSKADLNGDSSEDFAVNNATVANILTIPTAAVGTNTTQAASTAFVAAAAGGISAAFINNLVYPVGSIYTNMAVATNPATLLGVGTWVAFGEGRVLVSKASSGTFNTLAATGGAETHTLTTAELPSHSHSVGVVGSTLAGLQSSQSGATSGGGTSGSAGSGDAHNNLQPYIVVYMWKRTA